MALAADGLREDDEQRDQRPGDDRHDQDQNCGFHGKLPTTFRTRERIAELTETPKFSPEIRRGSPIGEPGGGRFCRGLVMANGM